MARARQLPQLYSLRGSLVNVTIANLGPAERRVVNDIVDKFFRLRSSGELQRHAKAIESACRETLGLDDDLDPDQFLGIAMWRLTVYLLYHTDYTFQCGKCGATHRPTHRGSTCAINQQFAICPVCNVVKITKQGDSKWMAGDYVDDSEYSEYLMKSQDPAECDSPIIAIKGERKSNVTPEDLLENPERHMQLVKEFLWNGFRQDIKENKIKQHASRTVVMLEQADKAALIELQHAVKRCSKKYHVSDLDDRYELHVRTLSLRPDFTLAYYHLIEKYAKYGISISNDLARITVMKCATAPAVEFSITASEDVKVMSYGGDEEGNLLVDTVSKSDDRKEFKRMLTDDGVGAIESKELQRCVMDSLPDGLPKRIWAIHIQQGTEFQEFSNQFPYVDGGDPPKGIHLAEFFNVTTREIRAIMENVRMYCQANGYSPDNMRRALV